MPAIALVLAIWGGAALACAQPGYTFTLDEKPISPRAISLAGTPGVLAEGDLVSVDGLLLRLGAPGYYDWKWHPEDNGLLLRGVDGGEPEVVGARITYDYVADVIKNPLAKLATARLAHVCGVSVAEWSDAVAAQLAMLDLGRCVVQINHSPAGVLPPLPRGLRYLRVWNRSEDLRALGLATALRYLEVHGPLNLELLAGATDLRVLDVSQSDLESPAALAKLAALRVLDLDGCKGLVDLAPVAACTELRTLSLPETAVAELGALGKLAALERLDISGTKVTDLSPLARCAALREVVASGSPVATMPREKMAALTSLKIYSAPVSDAEVARFAALHPTAVVQHRWRTSLVVAAAAATKLRASIGHFPVTDRQGVLFELEGAHEVKALLDAIQVDEAASGGFCRCDGDPWVELLDAEGRSVLRLKFHHGVAVRWDGWPGDGSLAPGSALAIGRWFADRGYRPPLDLAEANQWWRDAYERLLRRYRAMLPPAASAALLEAKTHEAQVAALGQVTDPAERAVVMVRMFGANMTRWNEVGGGPDWVLDEQLRALAPPDLARALRSALPDPEGLAGVARLLYRDDDHAGEVVRALERSDLDALIEATAVWALGHDRESNRHAAIARLREVNGDVARDALRALLAGKIPVRERPAEVATAGGGRRYVRLSGVTIDTSDRAHAAFALANMGDRDSLPAIRLLAEAAPPTDAKAYADAIALLVGAGRK